MPRGKMIPYTKDDHDEVAEACRTLLKTCMKYKARNIGMTLQMDDLFLDIKFSFEVNEMSGPQFKKPTITS